MHCPKCAIDLNDDVPRCPQCGFTIDDLDPVLGPPPERAGLVTDLAGVLTEAGRERLTGRLREFAERTGDEFLVVTRETTEPRLPSEYVFWLFDRWRVGGEGHTGLLVLLAMKERRIEVEVGFALEHFVTDAAACEILQGHAVPFLKKGAFDDGLFHSVNVLALVVEDGRRQEQEAEKEGKA